jgi:hypothetical protein
MKMIFIKKKRTSKLGKKICLMLLDFDPMSTKNPAPRKKLNIGNFTDRYVLANRLQKL